MGSCCSILLQCFGGESAEARSNEYGSDPNPVHHIVDGHTGGSAVHETGTANGSDPSTVQLQLSSPSQASSSHPYPRLVFTAKEIADSEMILDYVQQVINKHKESFGAKVIPPEVFGSKSNEGGRLLDQIAKAFDRMDGTEDVAAEAKTILPDVLGEFGDLGGPWAAAGVSMIAFISSRVDRMNENKEDCLNILEGLEKLSRRLLVLIREGLRNGNDNLREAIFLVCEGVIWCDKHIQSGPVKRFAFVNTTQNYIKDLKARIDQLYQHLSLDVSTETLKQVKSFRRQRTTPLEPYKHPYPADTVGLTKKVSQVLQLLGVTGDTIEPGVRAVLLHGIGGIGKTTLGNAVCAKVPIAGRFVAQVEVGENPTTETICSLQRNIYERLSGERPRIGDYKEGQEKLQGHLSQCKDPVLLFVDNVFEQEHLSMLLSDGLLLPDRSRLIVTSRDRSVAEMLDKDTLPCRTYPVQELDDTESEELFAQHIGGCPPDKEQHVTTILEICAGLPLALEVVGRHLKDSSRKDDLRAWKSAIDGLRSCRNVNGRAKDKLNDILRWSYEQVDNYCKQVFLDVSYLLRNFEWEWAECLDDRSALECLKDFSLVKKVEKKAYDMDYSMARRYERPRALADEDVSVIEVHDLLAALGTKICESSSPTRMSLHDVESFQRFLQDSSQDCHTIEGLVTEFDRMPWSDYQTMEKLDAMHESPFPVEKLDAMHESLRILVLGCGIAIREPCHKIPSKLRICSVSGLSSGDGGRHVHLFPYPDISRLKELRVLDIEYDGDSGGSEFRLVEFPQSLEIFQLRGATDLDSFHPDAFEKCTSLHSLCISFCGKLKELPPSFCSLGELRTLFLQQNDSLNTLPDYGGLQSLEFVNILASGEGLPSGIGNLVKLRQLRVTDANYIPNNLDVSCFTLLEDLFLECAPSLEELPKGFRNVLALKTLRIGQCTRLEKLPSDFGDHTNLRILDLSGGVKLEALPDSIVRLAQLEKLSMTECIRLKELPRDLGDLKELRELTLNGCENLEALPDSIVCLARLEVLSMEKCMRLKELPRDFGDLKELRELTVDGCENLEALPDSIVRLVRLEWLSMERCMRLKELPGDLGDLKELWMLTLDGCENLEALPDSIVRLARLQRLSMKQCIRLKELPENFGDLKDLRELTLDGCFNLEALPDSIFCLASLEMLSMKECILLELPENLGDLNRS